MVLLGQTVYLTRGGGGRRGGEKRGGVERGGEGRGGGLGEGTARLRVRLTCALTAIMCSYMSTSVITASN